jgi:signal transduction histidine kinase
MEKGQVKLHPTLFSFSEIIGTLVTIFHPLTEKSSLQLLFDAPDDLPMITADKNKIKQVFMNLLSNAIKFTPPGGSIYLQLLYNKQKTEFHVSISDTGIGIEADKLDYIFEKFVQIDSGTNREFGGSGLGLAVAKQMVELHGGTIWVESTVGKGSVFHITLPIQPPVS